MSMGELPNGVVMVALTEAGAELGNGLKGIIPGAELHGFGKRVPKADVLFEDTMRHLKELFHDGRPIVGICAAGILVRALATSITDKGHEPPVIALSEDGKIAVPLLGGHRGANRLARALAEINDGSAAVTTAGDTTLGIALDDPPSGWGVADPAAAKDVAADLLAGKPVRLDVQAGDARWLTETGVPFADSGKRTICVTDRLVPVESADFTLHPPTLAMGVGCERGTDARELIDLVEATLTDNGLARDAVGCVVSIDVKADEAAVHAVAAALDVPARFLSAEALEAETPRLINPSDVVFREVGCHGVAEGAALAAVGDAGKLIVPKQKSKRTTCAVARAVGNLDPSSIGRPQGKLTIVGIGPGTAEWRTPAVTRVLATADEVVGYGLYLDLLDDLINGKPRHDSKLSEEEARVRLALERAAEGLDVVLVSSGDAGIYALATLAFELLDRDDRPDWNRLRISVEPGVSAIQAAAARIGAPIGHDFCTISLSDLLTPWAEIQKRVRAAAEGDFVIAFYNPVSKRRQHQLAEAVEILLAHRPPETPVVLARNLGRDGEDIQIVGLRELTPNHADMLTLVLVGNSQTQLIERGVSRWVYTPRGYAAKLAQAESTEESSCAS